MEHQQNRHQPRQPQQYQQHHHSYNNNNNNNNNRNQNNSNNIHSTVIAPHYNAIREKTYSERERDPIIHLKNFNNWIKSVLLAEVIKQLPSNFSVLDLAGGKAGDLKKISFGKPGYVVLADIAENSVIAARERYLKARHNFPITFIVADCFSVKNGGFLEYLPKELEFDLVSCQFSLHYAFENEERAKAAFYNITKKLKPGGYFIGTIPYAHRIVKKIQSARGLKFGNSCYEIEFDQKENFPTFGAKYIFTLKSAVDHIPEWLIHPEVLESLGKAFGLKLLMLKDFHEYFYQYKDVPEYKNLLRVQKVFNQYGSISDDEWEVAGLYQLFLFQKEGNLTPSYSYPLPPKDIIKTSI